MTSYNSINKSAAPTYTGVSRLGGLLIQPGQAIGLLLSLTYSAVAGFTEYTAGTKNTTTYSTISKN